MNSIQQELSKLDLESLKRVSDNIIDACLINQSNGNSKRFIKDLRRQSKGSEKKIYKFLESCGDEIMNNMVDVLISH